jgi:hypothetical protein
MFVHCFSINTLQRPKTFLSLLKNVLFTTPPKELPEIMYKELGNNIPKCLQYEGGMGLSFTFCVDAKVDIKEICKKYNYDIGDTLYKMEIEEHTYNNNYQIYPTYICKPMYMLKNINEVERMQKVLPF